MDTYSEILALSPEEAVERGLAKNLKDTEYQDMAHRAIDEIEEATLLWEDLITRNNYGDEEALGLGKHIFDLHLDQKAAGVEAELARSSAAEIRNKLDTADDGGAFDLLIKRQEHAYLEQILDERDARIAELSKSKKGRRTLKKEFAAYGHSPKEIKRNIK